MFVFLHVQLMTKKSYSEFLHCVVSMCWHALKFLPEVLDKNDLLCFELEVVVIYVAAKKNFFRSLFARLFTLRQYNFCFDVRRC